MIAKNKFKKLQILKLPTLIKYYFYFIIINKRIILLQEKGTFFVFILVTKSSILRFQILRGVSSYNIGFGVRPSVLQSYCRLQIRGRKRYDERTELASKA